MNEMKRENYNDYIFPKIVCVFLFENEEFPSRLLYATVRGLRREGRGKKKGEMRRDKKGRGRCRHGRNCAEYRNYTRGARAAR